MYRYQSDLLARMCTDNVHEQQKNPHDQALELLKYEEKIHHLADRNIVIDLDDGVKHNYALFEDVLAKIK